MAGPAAARGGETLQRVQRELQQGWPAGLTVLTGDDLYHLDATQKALLAALVPPGAPDLALTAFGDRPIDVQEVVAAARSRGMFASRRVVLVRDAGALQGDPAPLTTYASSPPPQSFLLVRAPALDRRRKLHQALGSTGRLLVFSAPGPRERVLVERELRSMAAAKGLDLERPAAAFLADLAAGDFYRMDAELAKISTWLGAEGRGPVTLKLARDLVSGSGLASSWEAADAVMLRDRAAALSAVRRSLQAGEEPLRLLGGLAWRARVLLQARAMLDAGRPSAEITRRVGFYGDRGQFERGLASYELQELLRFPALLYAADRTLKSRAIAPQAVLEHLVDGLTAKAPDRS